MRAIALAAVVLAAACGGGAAPATTGEQTGAGTGVAATSAPAAGAAATGAAASAATGPSFASILGAAKTANYKVSYKWTTTADGKTETAEQTWYQLGAKSRFDFSTKDGSISFYDLTDGSFMCTRDKETMCLGMPKEAGLAANPGAAFQLEVEDRPDRFDPTFEGTRQIAGQSAQCFALGTIAAAAAGVQSRICYSSSGIPLLIQQKITGLDFTFEATSFSTNVSDADFVLPAKPITYGTP
jgi:hypothetical protein